MDGYNKFFKEAKAAAGKPRPKRTSRKVNRKLDLKERKRETPEDALRKILMDRQKNRRKPKKTHSDKHAIIALCVFGLLVLGLGWSITESSVVEKYINQIEIGFFSKGTAADKSSGQKTSATQVKNTEKNSGENKQKKDEMGSSEKNWTSEEVSHFSKLNDRKKELDLREQELNQLEEELQKQKAEIESRIKQLEKVRRDIASVLKERVELDDEKINKLVDFYSNMKPKKAAEVINSIDESLAVEIMGRMKKKNAAEILNLLKPDKAQVLSEKFAGYKRR